MAIIVWFMVKDHCKNMSQYCLMLFGIMCVIETVFDLIGLFTTVGGRKESHTSSMPIGNHQMSYTTIVETHRFFDGEMDFRYNVQSAVKIISPVVMLIGAFLA